MSLVGQAGADRYQHAYKVGEDRNGRSASVRSRPFLRLHAKDKEKRQKSKRRGGAG